MTIDEEARRALQSKPLAFLGIFLHAGNLFSAIEALIETGAVEFQVASLLFQIGHLKSFGLKQGIMKLPEFALLARAARGLGGSAPQAGAWEEESLCRPMTPDRQIVPASG